MDSAEVSVPKCIKCGRDMQIARFRCDDCHLTVDGSFSFSPLARLPAADQAFVMSFVRSHGNIKKMEELFAISYPTVKNRLNEIVRRIDSSFAAPDRRTEILDRLSRGEINVDQALELLG